VHRVVRCTREKGKKWGVLDKFMGNELCVP
jgi:hypothetical protein